MLKKHSILLSIAVSVLLLFVATMYYPGGSQSNKAAVGFDWKANYLSNLFGPKAVNGMDNPARFWAAGGMFFLCVGFALFFVGFSKKIAQKSAANIIKYCGAGAMVFAFMAVTPYHDSVVRAASTLALISMFYITVFLFKSHVYFLALLSVVCLLLFYCCNYLYYTGNYLSALPVMQKLSLGLDIIWALSLTYFTPPADFGQAKTTCAKKREETGQH